MAREILVSIYLMLFSFIFNICKLFPQKKEKTVFVVTFIENSASIYEELRRQDPSCRTIFLASKNVYNFFSKYDESTILLFEPKKLKDFIISIYHLATSKMVIVDNYYGFLSSIRFKKNVTCLQVWHASGAIKQFGLKDPSIANRKSRAITRFKKVYKQFHNIIVGSEEMARIFGEAFGIEERNILRTGMPRTDVFFNEKRIALIKKYMYQKFPYLEEKKVILYAPTFRDNELDHFQLHLNLEEMQHHLNKNYIVLLRLHPAVKNNLDISKYEGFVYDYSRYAKLNDILFISDILITDYSSIPFDFSILGKPMIFFPYDLEHYQKERGFWGEYPDVVPGPIARSTSEIITILQSGDFKLEEIMEYENKWNEYSKGSSSQNIASWILYTLKSQETQKSSLYET